MTDQPAQSEVGELIASAVRKRENTPNYGYIHLTRPEFDVLLALPSYAEGIEASARVAWGASVSELAAVCPQRPAETPTMWYRRAIRDAIRAMIPSPLAEPSREELIALLRECREAQSNYLFAEQIDEEAVRQSELAVARQETEAILAKIDATLKDLP
jgi:hypothetical protein